MKMVKKDKKMTKKFQKFRKNVLLGKIAEKLPLNGVTNSDLHIMEVRGLD
ncbi:hypothetical protein [Methanocaldococcus sp.]